MRKTKLLRSPGEINMKSTKTNNDLKKFCTHKRLTYKRDEESEQI